MPTFGELVDQGTKDESADSFWDQVTDIANPAVLGPVLANLGWQAAKTAWQAPSTVLTTAAGGLAGMAGVEGQEFYRGVHGVPVLSAFLAEEIFDEEGNQRRAKEAFEAEGGDWEGLSDRGRKAETAKVAMRRQVPLLETLIQSGAATGHRIANPTEYAKASDRGEIVMSLLEDVGNVSLAGFGASNVLGRVGSAASKAALAETAVLGERGLAAGLRGAARGPSAAHLGRQAARLERRAGRLRRVADRKPDDSSLATKASKAADEAADARRAANQPMSTLPTARTSGAQPGRAPTPAEVDALGKTASGLPKRPRGEPWLDEVGPGGAAQPHGVYEGVHTGRHVGRPTGRDVGAGRQVGRDRAGRVISEPKQPVRAATGKPRVPEGESPLLPHEPTPLAMPGELNAQQLQFVKDVLKADAPRALERGAEYAWELAHRKAVPVLQRWQPLPSLVGYEQRQAAGRAVEGVLGSETPQGLVTGLAAEQAAHVTRALFSAGDMGAAGPALPYVGSALGLGKLNRWAGRKWDRIAAAQNWTRRRWQSAGTTAGVSKPGRAMFAFEANQRRDMRALQNMMQGVFGDVALREVRAAPAAGKAKAGAVLHAGDDVVGLADNPVKGALGNEEVRAILTKMLGDTAVIEARWDLMTPDQRKIAFADMVENTRADLTPGATVSGIDGFGGMKGISEVLAKRDELAQKASLTDDPVRKAGFQEDIRILEDAADDMIEQGWETYQKAMDYQKGRLDDASMARWGRAEELINERLGKWDELYGEGHDLGGRMTAAQRRHREQNLGLGRVELAEQQVATGRPGARRLIERSGYDKPIRRLTKKARLAEERLATAETRLYLSPDEFAEFKNNPGTFFHKRITEIDRAAAHAVRNMTDDAYEAMGFQRIYDDSGALIEVRRPELRKIKDADGNVIGHEPSYRSYKPDSHYVSPERIRRQLASRLMNMGDRTSPAVAALGIELMFEHGFDIHSVGWMDHRMLDELTRRAETMGKAKGAIDVGRKVATAYEKFKRWDQTAERRAEHARRRTIITEQMAGGPRRAARLVERAKRELKSRQSKRIAATRRVRRRAEENWKPGRTYGQDRTPTLKQINEQVDELRGSVQEMAENYRDDVVAPQLNNATAGAAVLESHVENGAVITLPKTDEGLAAVGFDPRVSLSSQMRNHPLFRKRNVVSQEKQATGPGLPKTEVVDEGWSLVRFSDDITDFDMTVEEFSPHLRDMDPQTATAEVVQLLHMWDDADRLARQRWKGELPDEVRATFRDSAGDMPEVELALDVASRSKADGRVFLREHFAAIDDKIKKVLDHDIPGEHIPGAVAELEALDELIRKGSEVLDDEWLEMLSPAEIRAVHSVRGLEARTGRDIARAKMRKHGVDIGEPPKVGVEGEMFGRYESAADMADQAIKTTEDTAFNAWLDDLQAGNMPGSSANARMKLDRDTKAFYDELNAVHEVHEKGIGLDAAEVEMLARIEDRIERRVKFEREAANVEGAAAAAEGTLKTVWDHYTDYKNQLLTDHRPLAQIEAEVHAQVGGSAADWSQRATARQMEFQQRLKEAQRAKRELDDMTEAKQQAIDAAHESVRSLPRPLRVMGQTSRAWGEAMQRQGVDVGNEMLGSQMAHEMTTTVDDLLEFARGMEQGPVYLPGGQLRYRAGGHGALEGLRQAGPPMARKIGATERIGEGVVIPRTAQGQVQMWDRMLAAATQKRTAYAMPVQFGEVPANWLPDTSAMSGDQIILEFNRRMREEPNRGYEYVPYNPEGLFETVAASQVTGDTVFIPKPLFDVFKQQWSVGPGERAARAWIDKPTRVWKDAVLALSPSWHKGNIIGGFLLATLAAGETPWAIVSQMKQAWDTVRHRPLEMDPRLHNIGVEPGFNRWSGQYETLDLDRASLYPAAQKAPRRLRRWINGSYRFNESVDAMYRQAVYSAKRGKGYSDAAAVEMALKALPDFNLNWYEQRYLRRLIPFYAWQKHVTRVAFRLARDHPARVMWTWHLGQMFKPEGAAEDVPWLAGMFPMSGSSFLAMGNINPYAEQVVYNPLEIPRSVNPLFKTGLELGTGISMDRQFGPVSRARGSAWYDEYGKAKAGTPLLADLAAGGLSGLGRTGYRLGGLTPQTRAVRDLLTGGQVRYDTGEPVLTSQRVGDFTLTSPMARQQPEMVFGGGPVLGELGKLLGIPYLTEVDLDNIRSRREALQEARS